MLRILCFAEAPADARLGSALGDRVLVEEGPEWIEADLLPSLRTWTGLKREEPFTKWTSIKQSDDKLRSPRFIGHATGGPRGSDYAMAFKALTQAALLHRGPSEALAVVLLRDCDASRDRRAGLRQAATEPRFAGLNVIVGIADKMREAWVLSGFDPRCGDERSRLEALRVEIGFDPTRQAERLRAASRSEARHPKTALARLTEGEAEREEACWTEPPLMLLRTRGAKCGLATYLDELRDRLPSLVGGEL